MVSLPDQSWTSRTLIKRNSLQEGDSVIRDPRLIRETQLSAQWAKQYRFILVYRLLIFLFATETSIIHPLKPPVRTISRLVQVYRTTILQCVPSAFNWSYSRTDSPDVLLSSPAHLCRPTFPSPRLSRCVISSRSGGHTPPYTIPSPPPTPSVFIFLVLI